MKAPAKKAPIPKGISAYVGPDGSTKSSYSAPVDQSPTAADLVNAIDKAFESVKAARAAIAQIHIPETIQDEDRKHAEWYPLLRRMVLAQIKGDYEAGERFNLIIQEHGAPNNDAEFDAFMELAAKAMGARA